MSKVSYMIMDINFQINGNRIFYSLLSKLYTKLRMTSPLKNVMIWLTNSESLIITQTCSETVENFKISSKVNLMN